VSEPLKTRVVRAYRRHVDYRHQAALRCLVAFVVTFVFLRALTFGIHYRLLPVHDIVTGGLHIHHFVWGILIMLVVGFLALSVEQARWHPWLAIPFGIAAALILDEFALWLNLRDVYWQKQGRESVDAIAIFSCLLLWAMLIWPFAVAVWRHLRRV